jgi:hypothetical protein
MEDSTRIDDVKVWPQGHSTPKAIEAYTTKPAFRSVPRLASEGGKQTIPLVQREDT